MTDDLDRLRAALKAAPPAVDPAAQAAALARALQKFDELHVPGQEPADDRRPMSDRPKPGHEGRPSRPTGVRAMLNKLTLRPMLAASASVAALGLGVIVLLPALRDVAPPGLPVPVRTEAPAKPAQMPAEKPEAAADALTRQSAIAEEQAAPAPTAPPVVTAPEADAPAEAPLAGALGKADDAALADDAEGRLRAQGGAAAPMAEAMMMEAAPSMVLPAPADPFVAPAPDTSAFATAAANPVKIVADDPVSTFSIDVDTAAYAYVRGSLTAGQLPPPEAVRIEEMVNYFPYAYPAPQAGEAPFRPTVTVVQTPWNPDSRLVHIGIQGRLPDLADRPPLNLVFLIDTSGSMEDANKLPLLIQSFKLMLGQLRDTDRVAIVTYAGSAGEVLAPTPASDRAAIGAALDRLGAGGSTAGQAGLQQAYGVAEAMQAADDAAVTRVILATDGDFNVGLDDPEALKTFIADKRKGGTYLSVLGFGRGNLDDATMQALAQNGNGTAAYIDTLSEAQKVLVDQLTGALFPIADDVKIQMEFNPAVVSEYRLLGYETRALNREDFNNDRIDAGEIGAGTAVTAIYEVTPVGSPSRLNDPLRYQASEPAPVRTADATELGYLKIRWKEPGATQSRLIETPVAPAPQEAGEDARFAIAIAGFGQLLTRSAYLGDWGWDQAIALANGAKGADPFGYRAEAVQLMRLAESLSR